MNARNPSNDIWPVNAVAEGGAAQVMLAGSDVLACFTQCRQMQGSGQSSSTCRDVTSRFASAQHTALFDADPGSYLPQTGGYRASGIVDGIGWGGSADTWRIVDGKLCILGGQDSTDAHDPDLPGDLTLSQRCRTEEVSGIYSFCQRRRGAGRDRQQIASPAASAADARTRQ